MRILPMSAVLMLLVACWAGVLQAETPRGIWHSELDAAWQQAQSSGQPMLLFVTMNGCTYCNKMTHHTFADAQVRADLNDSFVAASIDGVKHPQVARQLKVRMYPATFLVGPDTRVLDRIDGYVTPVELRKRLAKASQSLAEATARQAQLPRR